MTTALATTIQMVNGQVRFTFAGRPYGPKLASLLDAQEFLQTIVDETGLDPHHQSPERLAERYAAWRRGRAGK